MIRVGIAFQVAVNFLLMVEVVGQRRVKLRLREVRQALQNLVRRHAELVIAGNRAHRDARAFDDRHAIQDARTGRDVRILDAVCFHAIKLAVFRHTGKPVKLTLPSASVGRLFRDVSRHHVWVRPAQDDNAPVPRLCAQGGHC